MSINFPTSLDSFTHPNPTDPRSGSTSLSTYFSNAQDVLAALEAKVGIDGSLVTTSFDYKLSGVTGTDKAVSKTGIETLTNKTLTTPKITIGSDAAGDMYYRDGSGNFQRLAPGAASTILNIDNSTLLPAWIPNPSASNASTTAKGIVQEATQSQVDAKTQAGTTGAELFVNPSLLRATKYNDYVADSGSSTAYAIAPAPVITAYIAGQEFTWIALNTNTTSTPTLNVNGLGNKSIINPDGSAIVPGQIKAGSAIKTIYDGTKMQLQTGGLVGGLLTGKSVFADVVTGGTVVTNATTTVFTGTVAANTYGANTVMRINADFAHNGNSGAPTRTINFKLGGVTLFSFTSATTGTSETLHVEAWVNFGAAAGTADIRALFHNNPSSSSITTTTSVSRAASTADLTTNQTFLIEIVAGANAVGNYYSSSVEKI